MFLERRLSRLLPAAVVVVAVCAWLVPRVASSGQLVNWNRDVVSSLTGWMNWNQIAAGNGYFARTVLPTPLLHFWSYAIELQFYFLWPMLFWGCVRAFHGRSGRGDIAKFLRTCRWACVAIACASFLAQVIIGNTSGVSRAYFGTDTRVGAIFLGAALAFTPEHELRTHARTWMLWGRRGLTVVAGVVWLTIVLRVHANDSSLVRGVMIVASLCALVLLDSALQVQSKHHPLCNPVLGWIGKISYSVYLWHFPLWYVWLTPSRTGLGSTSLVIVRFAAAFAAGTLSYLIVERQAWRRVTWRWSSRRTPKVSGMTFVGSLEKHMPGASGVLSPRTR